MATINGSTSGSTEPLIPVFKCENYEFWSIHVKMLLKSQYLWDLVGQRYVELAKSKNLRDDEATKLRETRKRDPKALAIIQQAVHDLIFSRIVAANTSKQAWSVLKTEFQ